MKYKLVKRTNKTLPSNGKYVAKVVHGSVLTADELCDEIQENCSAKRSDVFLVLMELQDVLMKHLRQGDKVELPAIGTFKLEINSRAVDAPEEFVADDHVRSVRLHVLPKSKNGTPELYNDIPLEKMNI